MLAAVDGAGVAGVDGDGVRKHGLGFVADVEREIDDRVVDVQVHLGVFAFELEVGSGRLERIENLNALAGFEFMLRSLGKSSTSSACPDRCRAQRRRLHRQLKPLATSGMRAFLRARSSASSLSISSASFMAGEACSVSGLAWSRSHLR